METGLKYTSEMVVGFTHLAEHLGSGDLPVFGTPAMLALMENAAMLAVAPYLSAEESTVGGQISSSHLKPSRIGAQIRATAVLTAVEGRKLTFHISAYEGETLIGEGTHTRFIINRAKFLGK